MEPKRRQQRMARAIRDIVSETIMGDINDPRLTGFVSITDVELSSDLRYASVYLRCFGTEDAAASKKTFAAIDHARGFIQSKLAAELNVRFCPVISFYEDLKQEKVQQVMRLIEDVSKDFKDNQQDCPEQQEHS
jgi:ribosome-binding factor A